MDARNQVQAAVQLVLEKIDVLQHGPPEVDNNLHLAPETAPLLVGRHGNTYLPEAEAMQAIDLRDINPREDLNTEHL
eukprot:s934_g8.t1